MKSTHVFVFLDDLPSELGDDEGADVRVVNHGEDSLQVDRVRGEIDVFNLHHILLHFPLLDIPLHYQSLLDVVNFGLRQYQVQIEFVERNSEGVLKYFHTSLLIIQIFMDNFPLSLHEFGTFRTFLLINDKINRFFDIFLRLL